jgi:hypothetical protein
VGVPVLENTPKPLILNVLPTRVEFLVSDVEPSPVPTRVVSEAVDATVTVAVCAKRMGFLI